MEKRTIIIIKKEYGYSDGEHFSYVGEPCEYSSQAVELIYAQRHYGCEFHTSYVNNGTNYVETHASTGEIVAEYFLRLVVDI